MLRWLTSLIWLVATLSFGFDAVAQPCDMLERLQASHMQAEHSAMPCHDVPAMGMSHETGAASEDAPPAHKTDTCCCAMLLSTAIVLDPVEMTETLLHATWLTPAPEAAKSYLFEYEPPPPRA